MNRAFRRGTAGVTGLWNYLLLGFMLAAVAVVVLVVAMALGWNSPRPDGPPDWEIATFPRRITVPAGECVPLLLDQSVNDFSLEVTALPVAPSGSALSDYGLIYRAQDLSRYYAFLVGADGYYTVVRIDGRTATPLVPWQQFPHIRRGGQLNRLLVTCAGSVCDFRVNDEYAATVEDDEWLSGEVGIFARAVSERSVFRFVRVRLWLAGS